MPLPIEKPQASVSALVARFQTAASRDQEAAEREKTRQARRSYSNSVGLGRRNGSFGVKQGEGGRQGALGVEGEVGGEAAEKDGAKQAGDTVSANGKVEASTGVSPEEPTEYGAKDKEMHDQAYGAVDDGRDEMEIQEEREKTAAEGMEKAGGERGDEKNKADDEMATVKTTGGPGGGRLSNVNGSTTIASGSERMMKPGPSPSALSTLETSSSNPLPPKSSDKTAPSRPKPASTAGSTSTEQPAAPPAKPAATSPTTNTTKSRTRLASTSSSSCPRDKADTSAAQSKLRGAGRGSGATPSPADSKISCIARPTPTAEVKASTPASASPAAKSPPARIASDGSATKPLFPAKTGPNPHRSSFQSHAAASPLRPQLTGTPIKPTASFLAKARSPAAGATTPTATPVRTSGAIKQAASLGRASGSRLSIGSATDPKERRTSLVGGARIPRADMGSPSPASRDVSREAEKGTPSPRTSTISCRLLQGTAASRAKAASGTTHSPAKAGSTKPWSSTTTPTRNTKGLIVGSPGENGAAARNGGSGRTLAVGKSPIGRLGLAAARSGAPSPEDRMVAPTAGPNGDRGGSKAAEQRELPPGFAAPKVVATPDGPVEEPHDHGQVDFEVPRLSEKDEAEAFHSHHAREEICVARMEAVASEGGKPVKETQSTAAEAGSPERADEGGRDSGDAVAEHAKNADEEVGEIPDEE